MMSTYSSTEDKTSERNETLNATNALTGWGQFWAILRMSFWKNKNIAIVAAILMLVTLPLILLFSPKDVYQGFQSNLFLGLLTGLILPVSIIVIVLMSSQMFSFLHQRPSLDVYHALPVRRLPMFFGRYVAGYLVVLLPQMITFAITLLVCSFPPLQDIGAEFIIKTFLSIALMSLAFYSFTCLAFVLTGTFFDALFLLLLLNIAYPVTLYTIEFMTNKVLPGFTMSGLDITSLSRYLLLSPLGQLFSSVLLTMNLFQVIWWVVVVLAVISGSFLVYKKRKSELAGMPFAYRTPFLITRFLACVAIGLLFGYLIYDSSPSLLSFIAGVLVGSMITHLIIEIILNRGLSKFRRSLISYGVFIVIFAIGCVSVAYGFFGFDNRSPDAANVVQVELLSNNGSLGSSNSPGNLGYIFDDPKDIAIIIELQKAWLDQMPTIISKPYSLRTNEMLLPYAYKGGGFPFSFQIKYLMSTGLEMVRTVYLNLDSEPYSSIYNKLRKSANYKRQHYANIFALDGGSLDRIEIVFKTGENACTITKENDQELLTEIQNALQRDLLNNADTKTESNLVATMSIQTVYFNQIDQNAYQTATDPYFLLTDAFAETLKVLNDKKLLDKQNEIVDKYTSAFIIVSSNKSSMLLETLSATPFQAGKFYLPSTFGGTDFFSPLMNDTNSFVKTDKAYLIKDLYEDGQSIESFKVGGYLILLATEGQVQGDGYTAGGLPVLYLPKDKIPAEIAALLQP